jgi:DNA-binding beta-propeller fold protein YncE
MLVVDGVPMPRDVTNAFVEVGGGSLWVSTGLSPARVLRYSLRTLRLQRRFEFAYSQAPFTIVFGHGAAWTVQGFASTLLRIDASSGETSAIPVGRLPGEPEVGFESVWVTMIGEDTVWRIDPLAMNVASIVKVGDGPFGAANGSGALWVSNNCDATVSRIDPTLDESVATIETLYYPRDLDAGHGYVWVGVGAEPFDFGFPVCN